MLCAPESDPLDIGREMERPDIMTNQNLGTLVETTTTMTMRSGIAARRVYNPTMIKRALSEQRQAVCVGRSKRRPKRRLGREGAPLGQRGGAPLFVILAGDEMALLIEMVVDLGMN